jgi:hypothetical protein
VTPILTVLVLMVVGWFAIGTIWNVRKGSAAMRWMHGGLPLIGERTTVRWLGTTSVELSIRNPKPPFAQVVLVIFLEPRDVPWLWAFAQSRGRRDTLIIRAMLRRPPVQELDAIDSRSWSGRDALHRLDRAGWSQRPGSGPQEPPLLISQAGSRAEGLLDLARGAGMAVRRLSLRRSEPHLQLHVDLPALRADASVFFHSLRAIGESAGS